MVALGVDREGKKLPLGFWEGATENHEICEELLEELERRGLKLSKRILWVTDGGGGIIKALKDRYGKKLIHQRCTLHKDRNIQRHLPKRYRKQAHSGGGKHPAGKRTSGSPLFKPSAAKR